MLRDHQDSCSERMQRRAESEVVKDPAAACVQLHDFADEDCVASSYTQSECCVCVQPLQRCITYGFLPYKNSERVNLTSARGPPPSCTPPQHHRHDAHLTGTIPRGFQHDWFFTIQWRRASALRHTKGQVRSGFSPVTSGPSMGTSTPNTQAYGPSGP